VFAVDPDDWGRTAPHLAAFRRRIKSNDAGTSPTIINLADDLISNFGGPRENVFCRYRRSSLSLPVGGIEVKQLSAGARAVFK